VVLAATVATAPLRAIALPWLAGAARVTVRPSRRQPALARAFIDAKMSEREQRHKRAGESRYLVEPNVKEGKGGLRDLNTLFWIAKYLYRVEDVGELVAKGVFTAEELAACQGVLARQVARLVHLGTAGGEDPLDLLLLVVAEAELARHPLEHPRSLHAHHRARSVAHHARGRRPAMIAMAHARTATGTRTWALLRLGRHRHAHRHGGNRGHAEPVLPVHLVLSSSMPSRLGLVG
jgi:hypothetical protein